MASLSQAIRDWLHAQSDRNGSLSSSLPAHPVSSIQNPEESTIQHQESPPTATPPAVAPSSEKPPTEAPARLTLNSPEPWPHPVDVKSLLAALVQILKRLVVLPKWAAETLALWILHTYAFHLRDITTYIGIESPEKRCGKTTLLTLLAELANRAVASSNISPPAFFRVIEDLSPTLLIDEMDTFLKGNDQLKGILNSGYTRKTAFVLRAGPSAPSSGSGAENQNSSGEGGVTRFSCWCPKVMAKIGRFPDTLADRCIVIRMQRKTSKEQCDRSKQLDALPLRRQCARFVLDHSSEIAAARPEIPPALNDRAADIWEPLLVLADLAGGEWPQLARQAAVELSANSHDHNPTGSLLLDIFLLFTHKGADRIFTRSLVDGLNAFTGRPWAEMRKGKPIDDLWLAQQLRPYGVQSRNIWIDGTQAKGYLLEDFTDVFRRYIPRSELKSLLADSVPDGAPENPGDAEPTQPPPLDPEP